MTKYRQKQIAEIVDYLLKEENRKIVKDVEGFQFFEQKWETEKEFDSTASQQANWDIYAQIAEAIIFNPTEPAKNRMSGMNKRFSFEKLKEKTVIFGNNGMYYSKIYPDAENYEHRFILLARLGNE